jgi:putative chitinase
MMYDFPFTQKQIVAILADNQQAHDWYYALHENLEKYEINSILRVAGYVAQTCHESNNYNVLHENLNYRAESLLKVFPKYFNAATVQGYARQPEKIANRVYGGRMGNGPESSGDGYKYRGRGILQVTGKNNYRDCSMFIYGDERLLDTPELLESDMNDAVASACWYWTKNNLNIYCDNQDMKELTRRINGGYIGLDDRVLRYNAALEIFQDPTLQDTTDESTDPS